MPKGHSSPIVVGDSVIVTSFEPGKLSTICVARSNGETRWRQDLAVEKLEKTHPQHGPATATPVIVNECLFAEVGFPKIIFP